MHGADESIFYAELFSIVQGAMVAVVSFSVVLEQYIVIGPVHTPDWLCLHG